MSISALLQAVRDQLRQDVPLQDVECEVQEDGQPPPGVGQLYVSVHPLDWRPTTGREMVHAIDESYSVGVTITKRTSSIPRDRIGREIFLKSLQGFEPLARKVMVAVHQNYNLMTRANQILAANHPNTLTLDPFIETLRWRSTDSAPTPHDGTWLWADPGVEEQVTALASESLTIVFSEARRMQHSTLAE